MVPSRRRNARRAETCRGAPDGRGLQRNGGDEPQRARAIGKSTDGAGAALDFAVQTIIDRGVAVRFAVENVAIAALAQSHIAQLRNAI
jgi:hypothetical protein